MLPNQKELKKLITLCRKLGIKHFKTAEFEFVLADEAPTSKTRQKAPKSPPIESNEAFELQDGITEEDLLLWSSGQAIGN